MTDPFSGLGLAVDKPARLILLHPSTNRALADAAGDPAWIDIHSADSVPARENERERLRRRLANPNRGTPSPEEIEAEADEALAALIAGWRLLKLDGSPLDVPFSRDNARALLAAPALRWLRDRVAEFAVTRGNFVPPLSKG